MTADDAAQGLWFKMPAVVPGSALRILAAGYGVGHETIRCVVREATAGAQESSQIMMATPARLSVRNQCQPPGGYCGEIRFEVVFS